MDVVVPATATDEIGPTAAAGSSGLGLRAVLVLDRQAAVGFAATAVVALIALVRTVGASRGWFSNDDLGWQGVAAGYGSPSGTLLATPWNSHLQPVEWVLIWGFAHLAPLQFWPVVVSTAVLVPAHGGVMFLLLRRLFGARPEILPLLALGVGSSLTLAASLWWAVQLVQLPLLILSTLTVWAFLGYLQRRRRRDLALTAALFTGALLVSERAVLLPVLLLLLHVGWFSGRQSLTARVRHTLRSGWRLWGSLTAVGLVYVAWYVTTAPSAAGPAASPRLFVGVAWQALLHALAPAVLGGPWTWQPIDDVASVAAPGQATQLAGLLVVLALIGWSCATWRHAARGWGLLLVFLGVGTVLLTVTRAPYIGPVIGREYRYFTELALVAPLALGLAMLPLRWQAADADPLQLERRPTAPEVRTALVSWTPVGAVLRRRRPVLLGLATAAFLAGTTISSARYDTNWSTNSARTWVTAAERELRAHPEARLVDMPVPSAVVPTISGFYTRTKVVLRPVVAPQRFLTSGAAGDELRALGPDGTLRAVVVSGVYSTPGPVPGCGWLVSQDRVVIPLVASTSDGHWLVRMAYFTDADRTTRLTAGRTTTPVLLHRGLHVVYLAADGPIDALSVSGVPTRGAVCVSDVQAGDARAAGG